MIAITKNDTRSINAALLGLDKELKKIKTKLGISDTYNSYSYDYTVNNGAIATVSGAAVTVSIDNFELVEGAVVHIICPVMSSSSPTLNVNNTGAIAIKAVRNGSLITPAVQSGKWGGASSYSSRVWDANTTLTLIYNGTYWVIMGNPVFCSYYSSSQSYEVYANGLIEQWGAYEFTDDGSLVYFTMPVYMSNTKYSVTGAFTHRVVWHLIPYTPNTLRFRSGLSSSTDVTIRYIVMGY